MDAGQLRRVQIIVEIVRRSGLALHEGTDTANGLAISLLHDAVEHTLTLILLNEHEALKKREEFQDLVRRVAEIFRTKKSNEMPFQRHIENLNRVRIDFKHHGNVPTRGTTLEICENVRQFVVVIARELLALDLDTFHPLAAIRTILIKEHLQRANDLAQGSQYQDAMIAAAEANWYLDAAFTRAFAQQRAHVSLNVRNVPGLDQIIRQVTDFVASSDRNTLITSVMIASGLDVFGHGKLRQRLPVVHKMGDGKSQYSIMWSAPYTADDVKFAVDQIANVTLWIEERFPTLRFDGNGWTIQ